MASHVRWVCGLVALIAPATAYAGNMTHPRTPVVWNDVPCATLVDRSTTAVWHLDYDIPYEDLQVSDDEVADSRTHQFFALCRDNSPQAYLPRWITGADIQSAADKQLIDPATVDPADVFETSTEWEGCWFRINGDAERLPISDASAAAGVDWDLTGIPAGGYVFGGYTWEPPINIWMQRPGFVKIHDGDPDAAPPVVAITTGELVLEQGGAAAVEGCVDAMDGATLTAYWALAESGDVDWTAFVEDAPVEGSQFAIELTAPPELVGDTGMLRVDVQDPMGRSFSAFGIELVIVISPTGADDCEGGGFVQGPDCPSTDGGTADAGATTSGVPATSGAVGESGTGDSSGDSTPPSSDGEGKSGCGCEAAEPAPFTGSLACLVLFGARRRRPRLGRGDARPDCRAPGEPKAARG